MELQSDVQPYYARGPTMPLVASSRRYTRQGEPRGITTIVTGHYWCLPVVPKPLFFFVHENQTYQMFSYINSRSVEDIFGC